MMAMIAKIQAFFKNDPENAAIVMLWVMTLGSCLVGRELPAGSDVAVLFVGGLCVLLLAGSFHLSGIAERRVRYTLRCVNDIRGYLQCGCAHEFNTCPVREEKFCHCLCHWPQLYDNEDEPWATLNKAGDDL